MFAQLGLTRATKVLEELGPWHKPRLFNDPLELRSKVRVGLPITRNHRLVAWARGFGVKVRIGEQLVIHGLQVRPQLGEDRHDANFLALVVSRLRRMHNHSAGVEVHVAPRESQVLRRAAQATEAAQGEQQLPLLVGACVENFLRVVAAHEIITRSIGQHGQFFHSGKRILVDIFRVDRRREKLLGDSAPTTSGVLCQALPGFIFVRFILRSREPSPPFLGVVDVDRFKDPIAAEEIQQATLGVFVNRRSCRLHVVSALDVALEEFS